MGYQVKHQRMKRKAGDKPNAEERAHMDRVSKLSCLVCGAWPVEVHHVTAKIEGGHIGRHHNRVVPLCGPHHNIQDGPLESVHALSHRGFWLRYGIDLLAKADDLWAESIGL